MKRAPRSAIGSRRFVTIQGKAAAPADNGEKAPKALWIFAREPESQDKGRAPRPALSRRRPAFSKVNAGLNAPVSRRDFQNGRKTNPARIAIPEIALRFGEESANGASAVFAKPIDAWIPDDGDLPFRGVGDGARRGPCRIFSQTRLASAHNRGDGRISMSVVIAPFGWG